MKEASALPRRVIATGGGTMLRPENVARMRETGKIIYLEASLDMLWQRVKQKKDRPLLRGANPRQALAAILEQRKALYEKNCDFQISTEGLTAETAARKIFDMMEERP